MWTQGQTAIELGSESILRRKGINSVSLRARRVSEDIKDFCVRCGLWNPSGTPARSRVRVHHPRQHRVSTSAVLQEAAHGVAGGIAQHCLGRHARGVETRLAFVRQGVGVSLARDRGQKHGGRVQPGKQNIRGKMLNM